MLSSRAIALMPLVITVGIAHAQTDANPFDSGAKTQPTLIGREAYLRPAATIEDAVVAPWFRNVRFSAISPDGVYGLVVESDGMPDIARLARPWVNLGGLQVDTQAYRERGTGVRASAGLRLVRLADQQSIAVPIPAGARVSSASWSPDGKRLGYIAHFDDRAEIRVFDPARKSDAALTKTPLLATMVTSFDWTNDGSVVAVFRPADMGKPPVTSGVAQSPRVLVSDQKTTRLSVFASLLQTPDDIAKFEYYTTGQLAMVSPSGRFTAIGKPQRYRSIDPDPGGTSVRAVIVNPPYSYVVPVSAFGYRDVILDRDGKELREMGKRDLQLGGDTPTPPVPTPGPGRGRPSAGAPGAAPAPTDEKRNIAWRADGTGMTFLQFEPASKENPQAPRKDRVMRWKFPFGDADTEVVYASDTRINSVQYGADGKSLFIYQTVDGKNRASLVRDGKTVTLYEVGGAAAARDSFALVTNNLGVRTSADGKSAFLSGSIRPEDPLKEGPRVYLDRLDLESGKRTRLYDSQPDFSESVSLLDSDGTQALVTRESSTQVAQQFRRNLATNEEVQLTQNQIYNRDLVNAQRETLTITRNDGRKFRVKVTMMPGSYRRPALFWFYPSEFRDQAAYDLTLRNFNKNAFPQVGGSNKAILLRAGYVLVEPDCPIFGDTPNDSYVPQLRNNLSAVIDELQERGWIDRTRLAIGGHSYGAFSTFNAMIHTPFFKAGIAGDGNSNRLLTPFGFQNESRTLWTGRETYINMSPILYADQMTGALFMYHGGEDQNVGTALINSERLFYALESLGKTAALVVYPYEDHGQIARQSVLDQWARFVAWLDKYLKN